MLGSRDSRLFWRWVHYKQSRAEQSNCWLLLAKGGFRECCVLPALQGELSEPVKADDCMWNIEGNTLDLTLQKLEGMHWWASVLKVRASPVCTP